MGSCSLGNKTCLAMSFIWTSVVTFLLEKQKDVYATKLLTPCEIQECIMQWQRQLNYGCCMLSHLTRTIMVVNWFSIPTRPSQPYVAADDMTFKLFYRNLVAIKEIVSQAVKQRFCTGKLLIFSHVYTTSDESNVCLMPWCSVIFFFNPNSEHL